MGFYTKEPDKKSGDGLAITEWNDISNALGGGAGLTLALNAEDKIGIGTNTPAAKLHLHSAESTELRITGGGDKQPKLFLAESHGGEYGGMFEYDGSCDSLKIAMVSHHFHSGNLDHRLDCITVNVLGNVGIGTDSPAEKLDVHGNVKATKFIGDGSGLTNLSVGATGLNLATESGSKVGIGTNSPASKLEVNGGDIRIIDAAGEAGWIKAFDDHHGIYIREGGINRINYYEFGGTLTSGSGHKFYTGGLKDNQTLKLQIANDGTYIANDVGIGTTSPTATLHVNGNIKLSGDGNDFTMFLYTPPAGSAGGKGICFKLENSHHGSIKHIQWDGDSNWDSLSDKKLKTDIENEKNILERVVKLDVKNYLWKDAPKRENKMIGFIAQDVKPLFPALVGEMTDPETQESTLTVKYANFGVLAIGAIKELKEAYDKRIEALEKEIKALKK